MSSNRSQPPVLPFVMCNTQMHKWTLDLDLHMVALTQSRYKISTS